ncbi:MAG TPA: hypothetical protein VKP30_05965 [Polyangiaceae bacterium]|nr:hypothetical protein [Polyangiaceae bacterium]
MAQHVGTPLPFGASVTPNTLRAHFEQLRAQGATCSLEEAIGFLVPLTVDLAQRHAAGECLYLNPSTLALDEGQFRLDPGLAQRAPTLPRDRACLAPEERAGAPGNARASVYAVGAMLYEALTGASVGPGMRRPTDLNPTVPPVVEMLLAKALVADPRHRPDDLLALAQALHHLAPQASLAPPPADESHLDGGSDFTVDVSMSMLPPKQSASPASPYDVKVQDRRAAQPAIRDDRVIELAALKSRLESDPRPRYVVVKDGMDHGPFSAVELLQQIATHGFIDSDILRDSLSNDERAIKDWDQFAPFAEQARLHRDIRAEKAALERTVVREQRSTRGKAFFGIVAVGALLAAGVVWFFTVRGSKRDDIDVQGETAINIETDGDLKGGKRAGMKGGGVVGNKGGFPMLGGGMSCEAAQNAYVEEMKMGQRGQADITAGQYGAILNSGQYLNSCGVPSSMGVYICAAIQNGRAVGISVSTTPPNAGIAGCIRGAVSRINFPSHPKLDVTKTTFAPSK